MNGGYGDMVGGNGLLVVAEAAFAWELSSYQWAVDVGHGGVGIGKATVRCAAKLRMSSRKSSELGTR